MAKFSVGCDGPKIYIGKSNKDVTVWKSRSEATDDVLKAAAQYLVENGKEAQFDLNDNTYILMAKPKTYVDAVRDCICRDLLPSRWCFFGSFPF